MSYKSEKYDTAKSLGIFIELLHMSLSYKTVTWPIPFWRTLKWKNTYSIYLSN